ncbi:XrtA-associated tyrosine autokinase [Methylovulum psychrotolerans]|jgi:exopolysaccharide/PEP-CTERM locus tyrosine autokinase|uniref:non-specific protein-tyrosine kinase n=1 Tax=Methylovulum psychrotolerans TaxID=1704499 RepID=A0A1Z4BUN7_9GAMM|nr:XrtA-associated tyrosine autokinase [Methylovulum psychrotolerans]ASF45026.1 protein tyrosine kinase [Methylovulum psychrotolerans]MBT9096930.1 XrtA-associated tyrosine autokinase [Methylovulum psychrotolerans]POZ51119.1 protein tyrosine kinase [Methylovulum psychrotolerans]
MSIIEKALNKADQQESGSDAAADLSADVQPVAYGNADMPPDKPMSTSNDLGFRKRESFKGTQERVEIDWVRLAEMGFVTPSDVNTKTIEEYRNIKRPLVYNAFGAGSVGIARSNLILVTSSVPGEGKTFTAINLALSIANERDKKVLLIDADVARPSVSKTLGINSPSRLGLIDYLENENIAYSDIELLTNMPGLRIIPAGKLHKYSTELLSSNKMVLFAEELSNRYPDRIVIFDSPPLLAATQGEVLAKLVGQVVLVVEAEKTFQSMVLESVNKLSACDVVLLVFNKTLISLSDGYYYGYGYGQYATNSYTSGPGGSAGPNNSGS